MVALVVPTGPSCPIPITEMVSYGVKAVNPFVVYATLDTSSSMVFATGTTLFRETHVLDVPTGLSWLIPTIEKVSSGVNVE